MTDRPYTDATIALIAARLADERGVHPEFQARAVLDELVTAGLLVTPRIQRDTEWLGRAYIYTDRWGKQHVLDPREVTVVLPQEAP